MGYEVRSFLTKSGGHEEGTTGCAEDINVTSKHATKYPWGLVSASSPPICV